MRGVWKETKIAEPRGRETAAGKSAARESEARESAARESAARESAVRECSRGGRYRVRGKGRKDMKGAGKMPNCRTQGVQELEKERDYSTLGMDGREWQGTVLLTGEADVFYFTGFYTTARRPKQIGMTAVILAPGVKKFIYPKKWRVQIEEQGLTGLGEPVPYANTEEAFLEKLTELLRGEDMSLLWIEYGQTGLPIYFAIQPLARRIRDIGSRMAELRLIKSPDEIRRIKKSAAVASDAMEYAKGFLRSGLTELEAAAEIECRMRKNGSDGVPFTMKLLSGERCATVTRVPGNKRIERGDLVLLDFGARCLGYSSDWTRTFCISECTKEQRSLYELVRFMEEECIKMIKPGLPMQELLKKAFDIAAGHPYGNFFNPHLGHSLGITSHEWPVIDENVTGRLQQNMVITIEPGIYVPGLGGVRIEDEILVAEGGYEVLTGLKEETFILPGNGQNNVQITKE